MAQVDYIYTRKDGGTTHCYGDASLPDSNFDVACEDEMLDGVYALGNPDNVIDGFPHWKDVCVLLEKNYCSTIEQIIAC